MWCYGAVILCSFGMAMATCYTGHSQLPWWALIVAIILAFFMFPFVCVIYAITGFKTDVQQLAQMLGAALVPGNSQANMVRTLSVCTLPARTDDAFARSTSRSTATTRAPRDSDSLVTSSSPSTPRSRLARRSGSSPSERSSAPSSSSSS